VGKACKLGKRRDEKNAEGPKEQNNLRLYHASGFLCLIRDGKGGGIFHVNRTRDNEVACQVTGKDAVGVSKHHRREKRRYGAANTGRKGTSARER